MVSNDANYPKMTQITGECKESDSIPIVGQLVVGRHAEKTILNNQSRSRKYSTVAELYVQDLAKEITSIANRSPAFTETRACQLSWRLEVPHDCFGEPVQGGPPMPRAKIGWYHTGALVHWYTGALVHWCTPGRYHTLV